MENDEEFIAQENDTEETENQEVEVDQVEDSAEDVEELKKKLATAEAQKEHWRKKATTPKDKKEEQKIEPSNDDLSSKDLYALMEAKVAQEDIDEVLRAAKALNLSVPEALKSNIVKGILQEKSEERRTANATQTRGGARGSAKVSGADILSKAERTGELPDSDEGMDALAQARMAKRLGIK